MPRRPNTRPTTIYWLIDVRPETLAEHPNGKPFYCGKTIKRPIDRLTDHRGDARRYSKRPISKRLIDCGDHVRIDIVDIVPIGVSWAEIERFWIATLRHFHPDCLNISIGGDGAPGLIQSDAVRAKLSADRKGKPRGPLSAEWRAKIGAAQKGKIISAEHRANLSAALKGRVVSDETRAKLSALKKGGKHSDESRHKMSVARRGKIYGPHSAERIANMSAARWGRIRAEKSTDATT